MYVSKKHQLRDVEQQAYEFIVSYKMAHDGNSPSQEQVGEACYLTDAKTIRNILKSLAKAKLIIMHEGKKKSLEVIGAVWLPPPVTGEFRENGKVRKRMMKWLYGENHDYS